MKKGDIIKGLRESFGMTQEELAKILGTTKQTVYKYETGVITNIPSDKIEAIADTFKTTPDFVMGWALPETSSSTYTPETDKELLSHFHKLTDYGKQTAIKRVKEMTELPQYTVEESEKKA